MKPRTLVSQVSGLPTCVLLLAVSCTNPSTYYGINLMQANNDSELRSVAAAAKAGDKLAQLQLGEQFERGNRVKCSRKKALDLYRQAAETSGGTIWLSTWQNGKTVSPIGSKRLQKGLSEAKQRYLSLSRRSDTCGADDAAPR